MKTINKKWFLALFLLPLAFAVSGKPASAAELVFDVKAKANPGNAGTKGYWRVGVYYMSGDSWCVQAFAGDGNPGPVDVTNISLAFYNAYDLTKPANRFNLTDATGGNINVNAPNKPGVNPVTGTRYLWDPNGPQSGKSVSFSTAGAGNANKLKRNNSDVFSAIVHVGKTGQAAVKGFTIGLQNGNYQWEASDITPEASSLALLLAGVLPIGVVLRRRRRLSAASVEQAA